MTVANVFNAKIVDDEGEYDGAPPVSPEARSGGILLVASDIEAFLWELVNDNSRLGKSINATTNFEIESAIVDAVGENVF